MGYTCIFDDYLTVIDREKDITLLRSPQINGIYLIKLNELIFLQELKLNETVQMNHVMEGINELDLIHERTGHVGKSILLEACRCKLVNGITLPRKYFGKKTVINKTKCDICSKIKLTRKAFRKERTRNAVEVGEVISTDQGVFRNFPSKEGFKYVQTITDHASKYVCVYGLRKKSEALIN